MSNIKARDIVRASVSAAVERRHKKRSDAAKQAAETRRLRTADRVDALAKRLTSDGTPIGPRYKCVICCRGLSDQQSIDRGIGSECWQDVLAAIAAQAVRP